MNLSVKKIENRLAFVEVIGESMVSCFLTYSVVYVIIIIIVTRIGIRGPYRRPVPTVFLSSCPGLFDGDMFV